jgi:pimeloyl-ACP methyl ester carboxylesterase
MACLANQKKSTIVRTALARAFGLGTYAPDLAARLPEHLWFRLPPRQAAAAPAPGPIELSGAPFELTVRGRVIRGWTWGSGPAVYLVHGWGGSLEQLVPFVEPIASTGRRVVAFDGPSHGHSDAGEHGPRSSDAAELGRALDAVVAEFGHAAAIVAHSMGALATMLALRDGWVSTTRLVFVAPAPSIPELARSLRAKLGFGDRTHRRLEARVQRRTGYAVDELDLRRLPFEIDRPQLLVVHDELDRESPYAVSADLVGAWPGARLLGTAGLGHRRILADHGVTEAVAWFVAHGPVTLELPESASPARTEATPRRQPGPDSESSHLAARALRVESLDSESGSPSGDDAGPGSRSGTMVR